MTVMLALTFAFICGVGVLTGFRDASNAVALPVRFRALTPRHALLLAALMKGLGTLVGTGLITLLVTFFLQPAALGVPGLAVTCVALTVTAAWGLLLWHRRVPGSTTHALVASLWGAALAGAVALGTPGVDGYTAAVQTELVIGLLISPLLAWLTARLAVRPVLGLSTRGSTVRVQRRARIALAVSTSANAFGHGVQAGQRLGLVWGIALAAAGHAGVAELAPGQLWLCAGAFAVAMAAGTLGGAWRISWTLTERLVGLDPLRASVASLTSAAWIFFGSLLLHIPMSSTHMTVAGIIGAGQDNAFTSIRWGNVCRLALWWAATPAVCLALTFGLGTALLSAF